MRDPRPMQAADLIDLVAQPSQKTWLGVEAKPDWDEAAHLAAQPVAFTARRDDGSLLACFGINETFPGVQGVAWSLLSEPVGTDHLALTRFIRETVKECGLRRVELFAKCVEIEGVRTFFQERSAPVDSGTMVAVAMAEPTPECRWAVMLGFDPVHVLRRFGFADEPLMMFERIEPVAGKERG